MDNVTNIHVRLHRQNLIRERSRKHAGAGTIEVMHAALLEGTAGTGLGVVQLEPIQFGVAFSPSPSSIGRTLPHFTSGFNLKRTGSGSPDELLPLMGFANVTSYIEDDNGYITGAVVQIGVARLNPLLTDIPFSGNVSLSWTGKALMPPLDFPDYQHEG